jgi:hypothetical protein
MTVPRGSSAGSAAAMPRETGTPDAVMPFVQYAVAINGDWLAGAGGTCGGGAG